MAEGYSMVPDVNEMFKKMGEKLGWFQNKNSDCLPKSTKKKKVASKKEGSEHKSVKKKEHPSRISKSRKKTHGDECQKAPAQGDHADIQSRHGVCKNGNNKITSSYKHGDVKSSKNKSVLDFNLSNSEDEDIQQYPVKRKFAHTNLPKAFDSVDACKTEKIGDSGSSDGSGGKSIRHQIVLNGFDLSSSEDDFGPEANIKQPASKKETTLFGHKTTDADAEWKTASSLSKQKPVKVKVSDSFAEREKIEDMFVSCVGESYVDQGTIPGEQIDDCVENPDKICLKENGLKISNFNQTCKFSVDDTIVQKPVNVSDESFSLDIDVTFGQPPCESTRIHRRSSVSYKKMLGSADDSSSSGTSDDNKHYKTCLASVSGDDLNSETDSRLIETACNTNEIKTVDESNTDTKLHTENHDGSVDTADRGKNELCKRLEKLNIQHENHNGDKILHSEKHLNKDRVTDVDSKLSNLASEQSFDEMIEVVDAFTQTDYSLSETSLSSLELSVSDAECHFFKDHRKVIRKKTENSEIIVSENGSDIQSDISEVEVKDMPVQTDTCLNSFVVEPDTMTKKDEVSDEIIDSSESYDECQSKISQQGTSESDPDTSDQQDLSLRNDNAISSSRSLELDRCNPYVTQNSDKDDPECEEDASSISDVESVEESNSGVENLGSESENERSNSEDDKEKHLQLSITEEHNTDRENSRSSSVQSDDTSKKDLNSFLHKNNSPSNAEVKYLAKNSWRNNVSDSSSEEDLDAYFEKLRNPQKSNVERSSSSEPSPVSMKDFIVEDDEMSSESDDADFYVRENRKLEETPLTERLKSLKSTNFVEFSDSDDSDFSTDIYPGSVTKHKKKLTAKSKTGSKSWSFSDEDEEDTEIDRPSKKKNIFTKAEKDSRKTETVNKTTKLEDKIDKHLKSNKGVVGMLPEPNDEILFKTPKPLTRVTKNKSDKENESQGIFKTPKSSHKIVKGPENKEVPKTNGKRKTEKTRVIALSDSDDEVTPANDDTSDLPVLTSSVFKEISTNLVVRSKSLTDENMLRTPSSSSKSSKMNFFTPQPVKSTYSFLKSLSTDIQDHRRDPEAARFVSGFKKKKEELTQHLFRLFNQSVFDNQLPADLPIEWNKRLLRTAGYCTYKKSSKNAEDRSVKIELSTKVCDSAERVRDTLIHELCHAAVWLINGTRDGHGQYWKYWARKSNHVHPEIPVIARCHDYSINTKYTYQCTQCGYSIGRHSKSLDTEKKVCGYCHGQFELLQNSTSLSSSGASTMTPQTPRTPNRFALYVKEHYNEVKKKDKNLKHGEVMKELSKQFAEMNKI